MKDTEKLLFYFLRKGLGETEGILTDNIPVKPDWERLFALAQEQAVTGLLIDGVAQTAMRPDRRMWEQWLLYLLQLEQANEQLERCGKQWLEQLEKAGIKAFIFKGSSVASWYPHPLHRSPGDVDVVVEKGWEKLEQTLRKNGVDYRNENGDLVLEENGMIRVEFHRNWEYTYNPLTNARLQDITRQSGGQHRELYLTCLILHIRRHFLTYGIGLKQVCDVAVMLRVEALDKQKTALLLKKVQIERFSRILFGVIVRHLGGRMEEFPLLPIVKGKEVELFESVFLNEGYRLKMEQEAKAMRSRTAAGRIAGNTWFWIKRGWRLLGIMPGEVFCFLGYMAGRRLQKLSN